MTVHDMKNGGVLLEAAPAPGRRFDLLSLAFAGLIAASLVPIWAFTYFPSQDGPSHLNNANILRLYPWRDLASFRDFYSINFYPLPNWTVHLLLAGLMNVFPALVAEKLFLSIYVVSYPLAFRYCARGITPAARVGAFLVFPLIFNFLLQKGYYNFSFSVVFYFICVGYWLRNRSDLTARKMAALSLLFILLYFCHLVSTTLACVTIGVLWLWFLFVDLHRSENAASPGSTSVWGASIGIAARTLLAMLPVVSLGFWYVMHQGASAAGRRPASQKFREIFTSEHAHQMRELLVWIPWESFLLVLAICMLVMRMRSRVGGPRKQDGPLLVVAAMALIYLAVPSEIGQGGGIEPRMVLYLWLTLALWLAIQTYSQFVGRAIVAVAAAATLLMVSMNAITYSKINDYLREYMTAAPLIKSDKTLLSLDLEDKRGILFVHPFQHAGSYIAAEREVVDFTNYEASTDYFPIRYLPAADPNTSMGDGEQRPYNINILGYNKNSGRSLEYVLLWGGNDPQTSERPDVKSIMGQLAAGYEQIYVSPQRGMVRLYHRK
jgi:hypothetical protein